MKIIWFVVFLIPMPLFILVAGLAAAAGRLASPVLWGSLGAIAAAGLTAARLAIRDVHLDASDGTPETSISERDEETCSAADVSTFVQALYARFRSDAELGPILASSISDGDRHLARMTAYWSAALRGRNGKGTLMPAHMALPGLTVAMLQRWLRLIHETTAAQPNRRMGERANHAAERIVEAMRCVYLARNEPPAAARDLHTRDMTLH